MYSWHHPQQQGFITEKYFKSKCCGLNFPEKSMCREKKEVVLIQSGDEEPVTWLGLHKFLPLLKALIHISQVIALKFES